MLPVFNSVLYIIDLPLLMGSIYSEERASTTVFPSSEVVIVGHWLLAM
jgi:hypothetical protein